MKIVYKQDGYHNYCYNDKKDKKDLGITKPKAPYIEEVFWAEKSMETNNNDDDKEYEDKLYIEYKITYIDIDFYLLRKGVIFLWEDLTTQAANKIIQKIMLLEITPKKNKPEKISLFINCSKGSSLGAKSLYYFMKSIEIKIETIGVKQVSGAGIFALLGGKSRLALPNSRFRLYPQFSVKFKCKYPNPEFLNELQAEHLRWEELKNIFTLETGNSIEDLNIISYMSTTEAQKYGIIDGILTEIKIDKTEAEKASEEKFSEQESYKESDQELVDGWEKESDQESDEEWDEESDQEWDEESDQESDEEWDEEREYKTHF
uniref:ATP-dependent Clp protease proteolytic subunit n=1 Tax=Monotropa uniflora TaxID=50148 RepID=A0A221SR00_MONUN|nr:ATP-dependent Clp protease proteolytic subunit [Monotropa uniflora]YP_009413624.1 ATP-dependent Clp protease proteolytic subunit [Monotropa uniflora]ASN78965.1 ATP-dependent Clp protease proteolytic subunit [Monotropa uniflora]ASN78966.1 ATP-dependent Clp protease proteolytic subunit [Monotropa uniflora]